MSCSINDQTFEKLLRQQAALAAFGSFAFREPDLLLVLTEATRICPKAKWQWTACLWSRW